MSNALHRVTKEYRQSVNTPDFPSANWIINPDLSAVAGQPVRYWEITGDVVTLADQATRDAIDAQLLSDARDSVAAQLDNIEDVLRAFMLVVLDEFNLHAANVNSVRDAVANANNLNDAKTAAAAVPDTPTRTAVQLRNGVRGKLGS